MQPNPSLKTTNEELLWKRVPIRTIGSLYIEQLTTVNS